MKFVASLILVSVGLLTCTMARPAISSQKSSVIEVESQRKAAQENSWMAFTQLLGTLLKGQNQAAEEQHYSDANKESISSFFNNLGKKFRLFGKRVKNAFQGK